MAGIYLHIPFCKRRCIYCNFFSVASAKLVRGYTAALIRELELQRDFLQGELVRTVYFGGGTPSALPAGDIVACIEAVRNLFRVAADAEITLEANPDDITAGKAAELKNAGINRISLGVQSFRDADLQYLHRSHNSQQVNTATTLLRRAGFEHFSIDLIFGLPTLTNGQWITNIDKAVATGAAHISAYALTVEEGTALPLLIRKGKLPPPEEGQTAEQFVIAMETLEKHGFVQYEISNYCRNEAYSKHNLGYWNGSPYLGAGASAHSYDTTKRQWNVASVSEYLKAINSAIVPAEIEFLSSVQRYNEYVMTSLRTKWGADTRYILREFGQKAAGCFAAEAEKHIGAGHAAMADSALQLTKTGKLFADGIASDLFLAERNLCNNNK